MTREEPGEIEGGVVVLVLSFFLGIFFVLETEVAGATGEEDFLVVPSFFVATFVCGDGVEYSVPFVLDVFVVTEEPLEGRSVDDLEFVLSDGVVVDLTFVAEVLSSTDGSVPFLALLSGFEVEDFAEG